MGEAGELLLLLENCGSHSGAKLEPAERGNVTTTARESAPTEYLLCTSLRRIRRFERICRLKESITSAGSTPLLVRSPPVPGAKRSAHCHVIAGRRRFRCLKICRAEPRKRTSPA